MGQFSSRSYARKIELDKRAKNPYLTSIMDSERLYARLIYPAYGSGLLPPPIDINLFENITHPALVGRSAADVVKHVLDSESPYLKKTASYRLLQQLLPLLS